MDPDYDVTFDPAAESSSSGAKGRFLDSLGFDEGFLFGAEAEPISAGEDDDGVVLSSQPEDFDPSPADFGAAREASFSSWGLQSPCTDGAREPVPDPAPIDGLPSAPQGRPEEAETSTEEDRLRLDCPECGGSLLLENRHLGIEGACVWCHAPLVAAASGRDGSVRIFPILGTKGEAPPPADATEETALPEEAHETSTLVSESSGADWTFYSPEPVAEELEEPPAPSPGTEPEGALGSAPESESQFAAPPDPLDLDSLYQSDGFVPPKGGRPSHGWGEPTPPNPSFDVNLAEAPSPLGDFASPSPWGPPSGPGDEAAHAAVDPHQLPTAPSGGPSVERPDAAPTWEPDFGSTPTTPPQEPSPAFSAGPAPEAMDEAPAGFRPAFGTGSAPDPGGFASGFPFAPAHQAPAPVGDAGFSFGSAASAPAVESPENAGFGSPSGFGSASGFGPGGSGATQATSSLPWGPPIADEAPEMLPSGDASAPAPALAPAEPAPAFPAFGFGEASVPHSEASPSSPFSSFFQTAAAEPPQPVAAPQAAEPATEAPAPTVVSQPLGPRPKPPVRKGFLVLMVVIVGFACGAALATFVLPVDRYVAATRAFLEAKLAPAAPAAPVAMPAATDAPVGGGRP